MELRQRNVEQKRKESIHIHCPSSQNVTEVNTFEHEVLTINLRF